MALIDARSRLIEGAKMNAQKRNIIGTCAGILLALTAGAPVVADDTELLLVTPSSTQDLEPNVLFIIDTSAQRFKWRCSF